jgi:hypothetical protein
MYLIISCSKLKIDTKVPVNAVDLYKGYMFKKAVLLARKRNWRIYVLSAKYGLIDWNTKILPYDKKQLVPYNGLWPSGNGYFLGGDLYFKLAPAHIKRLVPRARQGYMLQALDKLLAK